MDRHFSPFLLTCLLAIGLPLGAAATSAAAATTPPAAAPAAHAGPAAAAAATALVTNHVRPLSLTQARARGLIPNAASAAESCWTDNFYMAPLVGMSEGGSEDWCGNGSSITYAQPGNCYGTTSWPTWNYLGCSTTGYYGAGWNQAQQQVNWNMCTAWIPWPSNTCLHNQVNYLRLGFGPTGNVWTVSKGVL